MFENVFYFKKINSIGGVETWLYYLSCLYKNFTVFYREGDPEQVKRLAQNVEVIKYNNNMGTIKCKKFFCSYGLDIPIEAEENFHVIHCDYKKVTFKPFLYEGFKYIGVSKLVCDSFKELTGIEAELIYNPIVIKKQKIEKKKDKIYLISATRLSQEKGGDRIIKLAEILDRAGVDYDWKVYSNRHLKKASPHIEKVDTKLDLTKEIAESTYLVQLSDHEAFGLSVAEALTLGTPVIVTDIPAFKEIGCVHGKNAIVCDLDMKSVDIDMIKKGLPEFEYIPPKSNWGKYLSEKGNYNPNERIKVRFNQRTWDVVDDVHYKYGDASFITKVRVSELESRGLVERL